MNDGFFRSRGYLPHLEIPGSTYFLTLRLADTLPQNVLYEIHEELETLLKIEKNSSLSDSQNDRLKQLRSKKIEEYLDQGYGACHMANPQVAETVQEAIDHYDGKRYRSHVYCIMPNHLHWILTPLDIQSRSGSQLAPIIQSFKSFTSHTINNSLKLAGSFWSREYYDHRIRSDDEFSRLVCYTLENPLKAHLCEDWKKWPWSKVSSELRKGLNYE
jgi:REP element-mobilizing transposase RayT